MQTKFILPCLLSTLFFLNSLSSSAQNRKTIETTTDILMFITPVAGFAGSLAIGDYQGTKQIIFGSDEYGHDLCPEICYQERTAGP